VTAANCAARLFARSHRQWLRANARNDWRNDSVVAITADGS
jgi:hypothetical protein